MNAALLALTLLTAVYSRYDSGRPRLVVKATHDPDELLLLRYADVRGARPRVIAREELDSRPDEVRVRRIIDPKDVVVTLSAKHGAYDIVDRIVNDRFVRISDGLSEAIDLDGDGVPETIFVAYAGQNECGVASFVELGHWNGTSFVSDGRRYVTVLGVNGSSSDDVNISAEKRYAIRLFGPGRVLVDGKAYPPGVPFEFAAGCHTVDLQGRAKTRAFLEELPR